MSQASVLDLALPELIEQLLKLNVQAKREIALALWDDVAEELHPDEITALHRAELARRLADEQANPEDSEPWEKVRAELLGES